MSSLMLIHPQRQRLSTILSIPRISYNFSTINQKTATTKSNNNANIISKLAIGGSKLGQSHPNAYKDVIKQSLLSGINTFESGLNGDEALSNAIRAVIDEEKIFKNHHQKINLTSRFGYRTATITTTASGNDKEIKEKNSASKNFPNDVIVQESQQEQQQQQPQSSETNNDGNNNDNNKVTIERVYHNISEEYILNHCLQNHPMSSLCNQYKNNINFIYMVHNPEEQHQQQQTVGDGSTLTTEETKRDRIKLRLIETFTALEKSVLDEKITSYGVFSNALSLDKKQYLHLDWKDVIDACCHAAVSVHGGTPKLSTLQLPINLLETNGLNVASQVYSYLHDVNNNNNSINGDKKGMIKLPKNLEIYASRPLTYFEDGGVGATTNPTKFKDYIIPKSSSSQETISTHLLPTIPLYYQSALNTTLQYFDATHILEKEQEHGPSSLTVEERETIDGCRFLQSMIQDLDKKLGASDDYSFASYEDELYTKVIPLIHNTFDGLDDDSASVLQNFFMVHGSAVRYTIAHNTRRLLTTSSSKQQNVYAIPEETPLQHYALQSLLKQKYISKVVVGCPKPEHVLDAVQAANSL